MPLDASGSLNHGDAASDAPPHALSTRTNVLGDVSNTVGDMSDAVSSSANEDSKQAAPCASDVAEMDAEVDDQPNPKRVRGPYSRHSADATAVLSTSAGRPFSVGGGGSSEGIAGDCKALGSAL